MKIQMYFRKNLKNLSFMIKYSFDNLEKCVILYNVTGKSLLREALRFSALPVLISLFGGYYD